ncbi:hypothetical protein FO488_04105 [Geobacter sp. FeAm09]|uniref:hypothetical protein n=1 Tax=Geobacter sp. FeAm09 TaxID=2597769 RepID=UPI0011EBB43B|nr:hypothetical protein [Geobacter sp. FeAm09]QEM67408.1 hypothetical protein FO488_04105 [Geobacter sp. FeAm09]
MLVTYPQLHVDQLIKSGAAAGIYEYFYTKDAPSSGTSNLAVATVLEGGGMAAAKVGALASSAATGMLVGISSGFTSGSTGASIKSAVADIRSIG